MNEAQIRHAEPGPKTRYLWDDRIKGLGVRITPAGAKAFVLSYRQDGRKRWATLGRPGRMAGELTLRDARTRAARELATVRDGGDGPSGRREDGPTVAEAVAQFIGPWADGRIERGLLTEGSRKNYRQELSSFLRDHGDRPIASILRGEIQAIADAQKPIQRNRVLSALSRLFRLCETWEYRPPGSNPAAGIERTRERVRERVLSPGELRSLSGELHKRAEDDPITTAAIRMLALTGLRTGEVLAMRWQDVEHESGRLYLPQSKTGSRTTDLPDAALAILDDLPRIHGNPHCFAGARGAAVSYKVLRAAYSGICKAAGIEGSRLHDLRRTAATRAAQAGLTVLELQAAFGWKTHAMAARYVSMASEHTRRNRRAIGEDIAAAMDGGPENGNVVPLRGRH